MLSNNRLLWTLQILLAALYLFGGGFKVIASPEAMQPDPAIPLPMPIPFLRFIGALEVPGAIGLVLPGLTGIRRGLTPLAAGCHHHGWRRRDHGHDDGRAAGAVSARRRPPRPSVHRLRRSFHGRSSEDLH
jgi:hypothetical protein